MNWNVNVILLIRNVQLVRYIPVGYSVIIQQKVMGVTDGKI
jgi:hypothetical protein